MCLSGQLILLFALLFIVMGIYGLQSGRVYCRGWIYKDESPFSYWLITIFCIGFGIFVLVDNLKVLPFK